MNKAFTKESDADAEGDEHDDAAEEAEHAPPVGVSFDGTVMIELVEPHEQGVHEGTRGRGRRGRPRR